MEFVHQDHSVVVVRQVPVLLLFVAVFFSAPFLIFSLFHLLRGTDASGKYFCLFMGILLLWVFLEFVATRERIQIDRDAGILTMQVSGVFRNPTQRINLKDIRAVEWIEKLDGSRYQTRRREYVYLIGNQENFLVNDPSKLSMNHRKLGKLLADAINVPYTETMR